MFNSGRVRRNGFAHSQIGTIQQRLRQVSGRAPKKWPAAKFCMLATPT